jgi:hypothetical protein
MLIYIKNKINNSRTKSMVEGKVKFANDYGYTCQCGINDNVKVECGHSFCIGCVAKDVDKLRFHKNESYYRDRDKELNSIECYKCQSQFRISEIKLQCGCSFARSSPEESYVSVNKRIGITHR